MITFDDLCELLKKEDEVTVLEILDLHSDDLVNTYQDLIDQKQEHLRAYYGEDEEDLDR